MTVPFFCVASAFALLYLTKLPVAVAMAKQPGGYDNKTPREQQAKLTGWGLRALGAHRNAFETFAPFAAAVLISHVAGGPQTLCSALALTFVGSRVVYTALYIANFDRLRSAVWGVGLLATAGLFAAPLLG